MFTFPHYTARLVVFVMCAAFLFAVSGSSASVSAGSLAAIAPSLGAAASFAVLGASAVTNTGPTVIGGDLGISPNNATSLTGFPPGLVNGTIHAADALALQAQTDTTTAYNALASQACDTTFTPPTDMGGMTLTPGVYCFGSSAGLTGILTLNGLGNPNAVWVFKIGSSLTTAPASSIVFINGGSPCNVFFQITSSATLDTTTTFVGNIIALQSISLNNGASVAGRLLARNGAVTLINNRVSNAGCPGAPPPPPPPPPPGPPAQVPEGDTLLLVATGLAGLAGYAGLSLRARRASKR